MKLGISRSIVSAPLLGAILSGLVLAQAEPPSSPPGPEPNRDRQQQRRRDGSGARPAQPPAGEPNPQRLERLFNALDANGDGKIDREEMARKGPEILRHLQSQAERPALSAPGAPGRGPGLGHAQCPCGRRGFAMRGRGMDKGWMRHDWAQGRGWGRERGWAERPGWGRGEMPAFQPPGRRGGFGRMERMDRMGPMNRPPRGRLLAFRMLDANGDGRLEPPEIRGKIEMLERLLDRTTRRPLDLDEFMNLRPPAGPVGPRHF